MPSHTGYRIIPQYSSLKLPELPAPIARGFFNEFVFLSYERVTNRFLKNDIAPDPAAYTMAYVEIIH